MLEELSAGAVERAGPAWSLGGTKRRVPGLPSSADYAHAQRRHFSPPRQPALDGANVGMPTTGAVWRSSVRIAPKSEQRHERVSGVARVQEPLRLETDKAPGRRHFEQTFSLSAESELQLTRKRVVMESDGRNRRNERPALECPLETRLGSLRKGTLTLHDEHIMPPREYTVGFYKQEGLVPQAKWRSRQEFHVKQNREQTIGAGTSSSKLSRPSYKEKRAQEIQTEACQAVQSLPADPDSEPEADRGH